MEIQTSEVLKGLLGGYNLKKEDVSTPKNLKDISSEILQLEDDIKDTSIKNLLNTLFKGLAKDNISKEDVIKILNNSILQKSSKSLAGDIKIFIKFINSQESLSKLDIGLKNLLLHVEDLKNFGLQNQINRSGLFLESKLSNIKYFSQIPMNIQDILKDIQNYYKDENIQNLVSKILSFSKVDKTFINDVKQLISLLKNDNSLEALISRIEDRVLKIDVSTNQIKNADLLSTDSKIIDISQKILESGNISKNDVKELLVNLKSDEVLKNSPLVERLENIISKNMVKEVADKNISDVVRKIMDNSMDSKIDISNSLKDIETFIREILKKSSFNSNEEISVGFKHQIRSANSISMDSKIIDISQKILESGNISKNDVKELLVNLKSDEVLKNSPLVERLENIISKNMPKEIADKNIVNIIKSIKEGAFFEDIGHLSSRLDERVSVKEMIQSSLNEILNLQNLIQNRSIIDIPELDIQSKINRVVNILKQELELLDKSTIFSAKLGDRLSTVLKDNIQKDNIIPNNKSLELDNAIKHEITQDIKAQLLDTKAKLDTVEAPLHIKESASIQVDKILTKIEYFQLLSYASESNISYLPLLWDDLEEGEISIKKLKQKRYFCEIKLKLKEFGDIEMMIMLHDYAYINISFFTENRVFIKRLQNNQKELKRAISSVGLIPENIYFYDKLRDEKIRKDIKDFAQSNQIGKGIDIQI